MFASRRISTPHTGKREIAMGRVRTAAGILARNGAGGVDMTQVLGGHGAGTFHLYAYFTSMEHSMQVSANMMGDPAWASLNSERELNPSADVVGPELARCVAGEPNPDNLAAMVREYIMPRENLAEAISMVSGVQDMLSDHSMNVSMWSPVIAQDMKRLLVVYSAPDMPTLGKGVDEVGLSKEFQEMLVKASSLGTLDRAWGMVNFR